MMFSATDFLPDNINTLTNLATSTLPNFGSGRMSRLGTSRRRGISIPFSLQLSGQNQLSPHSRTAIIATHLLGPSWTDTFHQAYARENKLLLGCFGALGTVLRASLLTILDALGIQSTANHVVTHTRQILHTAAANQHDAMLLQVVAFTTDVRNHFETVGQTHFCNLTQSGVWLFRSRCVNAGANTTLLRAVFQRRRFALHGQRDTWIANQLIDGWHRYKSNKDTT